MATPDEQLQAMHLLNENWDGYGAAVPQASVLELAREFVNLIEALRGKQRDTPSILYVSPTRIGGVLLEWEDNAVEHEVEIAPDHSFSFLHRHKATGHIKTRKFSPEALAFLDELRQLLAA